VRVVRDGLQTELKIRQETNGLKPEVGLTYGASGLRACLPAKTSTEHSRKQELEITAGNRTACPRVGKTTTDGHAPRSTR
jgi:hypothetical protein